MFFFPYISVKSSVISFRWLSDNQKTLMHREEILRAFN